MAKVCKICFQEKDASAFTKRKTSQDGLGSYCRECKRNKYGSNPRAERDRFLRRRYGITIEDYERMLDSQGGGCAICGREALPEEGSLAVDHCHSSGLVRAILCGTCNRAIGLMRDDPALLRKAAAYLEMMGDTDG